MNINRICFITCVNDESLYEKSLYNINKLHRPIHFEFEFIGIRNAKSMAQGYNEAMNMSQAKYKVYLHQDVLIINPSFVIELLKAFEGDENLGLIGLIGSKRLPESGIWWESEEKVGKLIDSHTGCLQLLDFQSSEIPIEYVKVVDGLLIATQYDLCWREDIFTGWHFYDLSQCMEFGKAKYKVGIPSQRVVWCVHDCGVVDMKEYEYFRNIFLKEYRNKIVIDNSSNKI